MNYVTDFYAGLTPFYHLIYQDWESNIKRQASILSSVIREVWGEKVTSILDVSCGIGTQSLGLAELGYAVTGSDLCPEAVPAARIHGPSHLLHYRDPQAVGDTVLACLARHTG